MGTPINPYNQERPKKEQVADMFDNIAHRYDFLNRLLSLRIDVTWRRKAIAKLKPTHPELVLDVATGTGDFAIEIAQRIPGSHVKGIDISKKMLEVGEEKVKARSMSDQIELSYADVEALPFSDNTFDGLTVAFGVRNFENLALGLKEMYRVIKPGGRVVILELTQPRKFPVKHLFGFYFKRVLPLIGKALSKDSRAYSYLPESVQAFPERQNFQQYLVAAGFKQTEWKDLTLGICVMYWGDK